MSRKLAPEANRILFVKNLNYNVTAEQLFDLFGKFGPIRPRPWLTFSRFVAVLYHQPEKMLRSKEDMAERQENLERLKQQHGIE
ncbi:hypothetical protein N8T08_010122 [Aspergillus melleus]|uniref:Uncharacterized protein n=1 Tax=Aspergillus melleus TaxID=138277 RepID=A0ACC3BCJ9_9EURO|nr:hypothetical protein N8T08_010122 [Aspergillus melleus]